MCLWKTIGKILALDTAFALIPPILLLAMSTEHVSLSRLFTTFLFSSIYSNCIGGLSFATVPRLWPAVQRFPAWLRWPLRVAAIFANTVA